ncbi:IclR family transcriptional regulator [Microlunatus ginsengisoli]|uniref:IclR family transcriptional regulator n=1 Tax=Microlunatus ginsengisoli TaxID=363863 RepID=A0ABP7A4P6_9ACTN
MSLAPAADAVLRILVLLTRHAEPVPAAQIASLLDLPRSTAYRLLGALEEQGFVTYLPEERRYGLGVVAFELGSSYSRQMPLRRVAQPVLTRLVGAVHENAHLAVLHGADVYYVIEERAPGRPPLVTDVGVRLPATLTASGLAILSALSAAQIRAVYPTASALVQRDGRGPATLTELRRLLATVRQRGFAYEDGQVTAGLASVGVPVIDHTGHAVAGVSVTYQAEHDDDARRRALVEAVQRAADTLRRRLGG